MTASFTWREDSNFVWEGECRMRVPTIRARVMMWPVAESGGLANLHGRRLYFDTSFVARVDLRMQLNGPDVESPSMDIAWKFRCYVEADEGDNPCESCGGVGRYVALPGDTITDCPYCSGSGKDLLGKGRAVADVMLAGGLVQRVIGGDEI